MGMVQNKSDCSHQFYYAHQTQSLWISIMKYSLIFKYPGIVRYSVLSPNEDF